MTIEQFVERLSGVRRSGRGFMARCPAHDDRTPSLSVNVGDNGGIVVHCFGQDCTEKAVVAAMGLDPSDLRPNGASPANLNSAPTRQPKEPLAITEAEVERMAADTRALEYLALRGVSAEVAGRLRFGFADHYFSDYQGERPSVAMPHYLGGKLVGVKYRSIEGRHFGFASGSTNDGLFHRDGLDPEATEVLVVEGPLDAALLLTYGRNAVALQSATSKCGPADLAALKRYSKIYLIGDMDPQGQKAMDALARDLPPEKVSRVRLPGVNDVGELHAPGPEAFTDRLNTALRIADLRRTRFVWTDLETETEIQAGGVGALPYLVDGLLPMDDLTMIAGREGSCKTLLAFYIGKCVANGKPVFGNLATVQKPVLYLDAENHTGTHQVYLPFFAGIGREEMRFRTLRYGVPALNDPALIKIVEEKRPLLIVDSLIRFCGTHDRDKSEMTAVMEQLANLVTAGATVLLVHHTRKSDEEEYANSFAIGATVAFWYAVVAENSLGIKRVKLIHKKARGGSEINRNLIAFPAILDMGMFKLDGDPPKSDRERVVEFVRSRGSCNTTAVREGLQGMSMTRKNKALEQAVDAGELSRMQSGHNVIYSIQKAGTCEEVEMFKNPRPGDS